MCILLAQQQSCYLCRPMMHDMPWSERCGSTSVGDKHLMWIWDQMYMWSSRHITRRYSKVHGADVCMKGTPSVSPCP